MLFQIKSQTNTKERSLPFVFIISFLLSLPLAGACASNEEDESGYFTPNIDLFIFRHDTSRQNIPISQMGFNVDGENNVVNYLYQFFNASDNSINPLQGQNNMLFYGSKIRAIIVTPHRGVDTTYHSAYELTTSDVSTAKIKCTAPSTFEIDFSTAGIDRNRAVTTPVGDKKYYIGDLGLAGLNFNNISRKSKLYLTNDVGQNQDGKEIPIERDNVRIFFADTISPCNILETNDKPQNGAAGLASVGTSLSLSQAMRARALISISGRYTADKRIHSDGRVFITRLRKTAVLGIAISHEMGHFFGLEHSFENSCEKKPQGTTNRIMDYVAPKDPEPNKFVDCEQKIYQDLSKIYLDGRKVQYELDPSGKPTDGSNQKITTVSALYRGLSTDNQIAVEEGLLEIIDSDSYPTNSEQETKESQLPPISLQEIVKQRTLP